MTCHPLACYDQLIAAYPTLSFSLTLLRPKPDSLSDAVGFNYPLWHDHGPSRFYDFLEEVPKSLDSWYYSFRGYAFLAMLSQSRARFESPALALMASSVSVGCRGGAWRAQPDQVQWD